MTEDRKPKTKPLIERGVIELVNHLIARHGGSIMRGFGQMSTVALGSYRCVAAKLADEMGRSQHFVTTMAGKGEAAGVLGVYRSGRNIVGVRILPAGEMAPEAAEFLARAVSPAPQTITVVDDLAEIEARPAEDPLVVMYEKMVKDRDEWRALAETASTEVATFTDPLFSAAFTLLKQASTSDKPQSQSLVEAAIQVLRAWST